MQMAKVHTIVMFLSGVPSGNDIHGKLSNLSDVIDLQLPSISRVVDLQHSAQILSRFNSGEKKKREKEKRKHPHLI